MGVCESSEKHSALLNKLSSEKDVNYIDIHNLCNNNQLTTQEQLYLSCRYNLIDNVIELMHKIDKVSNFDFLETSIGASCRDGVIENIYTNVVDKKNMTRLFVYKFTQLTKKTQEEEITNFFKYYPHGEDFSNLCKKKLWSIDDAIYPTTCKNFLNKLIKAHNDETNTLICPKIIMFKYCHDNIFKSHPKLLHKFKFSEKGMLNVIIDIADVKFCYNGETPNYSTRTRTTKRGTRIHTTYSRYISSYTHYINPKKPEKTEELKIAYRGDALQLSQILSQEEMFMKIFNYDKMNDPKNLIILCDRVGFINFAVVLLNRMTNILMDNKLYEYLTLCDNFCIYSNTVAYTKYLVKKSDTPNLEYDQIINKSLNENNWLVTHITFEPLLEKIIDENPICLLQNIIPGDVTIKGFKLCDISCDMTNSDKILLFVLRNDLNVMKNDNEKLNRLFSEIYSKIQNELMYIYDHNIIYYHKLLEMYQNQKNLLV